PRLPGPRRGSNAREGSRPTCRTCNASPLQRQPLRPSRGVVRAPWEGWLSRMQRCCGIRLDTGGPFWAWASAAPRFAHRIRTRSPIIPNVPISARVGLCRCSASVPHLVSLYRNPIAAWSLESRLALRQESIDTFAELVAAEGDGLCDGFALEKAFNARLVGAFHHHLAHGEHRPCSRGVFFRRSQRLGHERLRGDGSIAEADRHCLVGAIAPIQHDHLLGAQATIRPGQRLEQTEVW